MDEADREALVRMSDESGLSPAELTRHAVKMFLRPKQRRRFVISCKTYRAFVEQAIELAMQDVANMLKSNGRVRSFDD